MESPAQSAQERSGGPSVGKHAKCATLAHMARIHYEIPDDIHRRAKAAAALKGQTLKDFLTDALVAAIDEKPKG